MDHPETGDCGGPGEGSADSFESDYASLYPLTEGVTQRWLRGFDLSDVEGFSRKSYQTPSSKGLQRNSKTSKLQTPKLKGQTPSRVTSGEAARRDCGGLPDRAEAIGDLHFPESYEVIEPARRRAGF